MVNTLIPHGRLTIAEISAKYFAENVNNLKKLIGNTTRLMLMVKANAYGHGSVEIARLAEKLPVDAFGVVCLHEARQLRRAGIKRPIVIMNYVDPESAKEALELDCEMICIDTKVLSALDTHAKKMGALARIHVKIDTGMHRSGLLPEHASHFIPAIENYTNVVLEGICTHLADADNTDLSFTHDQLHVFEALVKELEQKGIRPHHIHAANSAATIRLTTIRQKPYTIVRPGIIAYGLSPTGATLRDEFSLPFEPKPVLSLKTRIVHTITIQPGETVGYARTFRAEKSMRIGLIPVGYGDGFRRSPKSWQHVLVRGRKASVVGRISMDQTTIDVTDIPEAGKNDEVVLIGKQGSESISAEDVAQWLGTINYEVVTGISERVTRMIT